MKASDQDSRHAMPSPPVSTPRSILMIKSHSLGVGDLLRSSAAWRALKLKWPDVQLHLLFLSKHAGYPTEELIREHHLLSSAEFLVIQEGNPGLPRSARPKVAFKHIVKGVQTAAIRCNPDWVIDFESSGARTSILTWLAARAVGAKSLGINQVFGRSIFYTQTAPSVQVFAHRHGYELPLEYTYRDFVVLARWGIYRNQMPIELEVTEAGRVVKQALKEALHELPQSKTVNHTINLTPVLNHMKRTELVIGLNIGCGTPDAVVKRPDLKLLAQCMLALAGLYPHRLILTGAPNEVAVNQEFIKIYSALSDDNLGPQDVSHMIDYAGRTNLSELTGVIDACNVFISTDSGPYHMAVALKRPTLVWFTYSERCAFHDDFWCERVINPNRDQFLAGFLKLTQNATVLLESPD